MASQASMKLFQRSSANPGTVQLAPSRSIQSYQEQLQSTIINQVFTILDSYTTELPKDEHEKNLKNIAEATHNIKNLAQAAGVLNELRNRSIVALPSPTRKLEPSSSLKAQASSTVEKTQDSQKKVFHDFITSLENANNGVKHVYSTLEVLPTDSLSFRLNERIVYFLKTTFTRSITIDPEPLGNGSAGFIFKMTIDREDYALKAHTTPKNTYNLPARKSLYKKEHQITLDLSVKINENSHITPTFGFLRLDVLDKIFQSATFFPTGMVMPYRPLKDLFYVIASPILITTAPREKIQERQQDLLRWAPEIIEALQDTHNAGYSHNDLKPENLLVVEKEGVTHVELTDFGLASYLKKRTPNCGSNAYIAPELYLFSENSQELVTEGASDIWSFGILLFTALSSSLLINNQISDMLDLLKKQKLNDAQIVYLFNSLPKLHLQLEGFLRENNQKLVASFWKFYNEEPDFKAKVTDFVNKLSDSDSTKLFWLAHSTEASFKTFLEEELQSVQHQFQNFDPTGKIKELIEKCLEFEFKKRPSAKEVLEILKTPSSNLHSLDDLTDLFSNFSLDAQQHNILESPV